MTNIKKSSDRPVAPQRAHRHQLHGDVREDPWYWLMNRDDPEVIGYLNAENAFTDAATTHLAPLQKSIYDDMLKRIQETDISVPWRHGPWYYFNKTEKGKNYQISCRSKSADQRDEEVILDVNALAQDHEYFSLGVKSVSPNHRYLAYAIDTDGSENFTLHFKDLDSGETLEQTVPNIYYGLAWSSDESTVFYTTLDDAHRPWRVYRLKRGAAADQAELVYQEDDERFYVSVYPSLSGEFIYIVSGSKITSEIRALHANKPSGEFKILLSRQQGVEYSVTHREDYFYITSNRDAPEFRLDRLPVNAETDAKTQPVLPERKGTTLEGVTAFADHLVVYERHAGLPQIRICTYEDFEGYTIEFDEEVYEVGGSTNREFNTTDWRFNYSSLTQPNSVFDFDVTTKERTLLKVQPVPGGFNAADYESERLWATASDGVQIPISLIRRRDRQGAQPLLLTGYGSYGSGYPTSFSSSRLALLDRGISVAIAHVRGGDEMGRNWYEDGKFLNKKNSFNDFIAAADHLVNNSRTTPGQLAAMGGSAGGLLMGAVVNQRPDLFKAILAQVPFVDVVTTILDESLPLSVLEWEEWGNPNDEEYYNYMKSYSPYDNVDSLPYPAMLVTAGLNDPRVAFWEPAKWVAKLRELKTSDTPLLLKTNMGAGHGGASGRYGRMEESAFEYAFIVDQIL